MGVIDFEKAKKKTESAESSESPEVIDTGRAIITNPENIKAFTELQKKKDSGFATVAEQRRLGRLKKYGDEAQGQNKIQHQPQNIPSKYLSIAKLNKSPLTLTTEKAEKIIDLINDGATMIQACTQESIKPKQFLNFLDEQGNETIKSKYYNSRILLAEWYLERRESLEKDLRANKIDSSTYSTLANDYKYLAGKLAPLAYGDKIQLDAQIVKADLTESINADKIKQLNSLLNANIIDCEYIESAPARVEDKEKA